jgi:predicted aminopeptidase
VRALDRWLLALALTSALAGCVTINIYFPAAAAEKAADRIIEEVWQLHGSTSVPAPAPASGGVQ